MDLKAEQAPSRGAKRLVEKEAGSLREYEEEQKVPLPERISELADSYCSEHQVQSRCFQRIVSCLQPQSCLRVRATTRSLRT